MVSVVLSLDLRDAFQRYDDRILMRVAVYRVAVSNTFPQHPNIYYFRLARRLDQRRTSLCACHFAKASRHDPKLKTKGH